MANLQLSPRDLYDAQGNAFDRAIIGYRLGPAVAAWLRDEPPPSPLPSWRHAYPDAAELYYIYDDLACAVTTMWGTGDPQLAPCPLTATDEYGTDVTSMMRRLVTRPDAASPLG